MVHGTDGTRSGIMSVALWRWGLRMMGLLRLWCWPVCGVWWKIRFKAVFSPSDGFSWFGWIIYSLRGRKLVKSKIWGFWMVCDLIGRHHVERMEASVQDHLSRCPVVPFVPFVPIGMILWVWLSVLSTLIGGVEYVNKMREQMLHRENVQIY